MKDSVSLGQKAGQATLMDIKKRNSEEELLTRKKLREMRLRDIKSRYYEKWHRKAVIKKQVSLFGTWTYPGFFY